MLSHDENSYIFFLFYYYYHYLLFRATPTAHGSSQARGWIAATAAALHHSHSHTWSLTHWVRPGIEPTSSWIPVGFISTVPQGEHPVFYIFLCDLPLSFIIQFMSFFLVITTAAVCAFSMLCNKEFMAWLLWGSFIHFSVDGYICVVTKFLLLMAFFTCLLVHL